MKDLPEWERVLAAASSLQRIVPETVLVGGTAAAIYARHRVSGDADHTLGDLKRRFDAVLETLEAEAGWTTARVNRPVLILGSLDGIETGIRQLIRTAPLRTRIVETGQGPVRVPTTLETLRIKAALILKRNAARDYIDFIALADMLGPKRSARAMLTFDALYPQPNGQSAFKQLLVQLAKPRPYDRSDTDVTQYKRLDERYDSWAKLDGLAGSIAGNLFDAMRDKVGPDDR